VISVERLSGEALVRELDALAALRIEVFRAYPYLYEGSLAYEQKYLRGFASSPESTLVVARDGGEIVGASTAMPLLSHADEVVPPLLAAGFDPARVYYFGESVLRASHRGRGIGHRFFDLREEAAREHGYALATFCAVVRSADDPRRPPDDRSLEPFWMRRGYIKRPDIMATFRWRDIGQPAESDKKMVFWLKELS
jgi:GNAT superfamily N-acetyltransferase